MADFATAMTAVLKTENNYIKDANKPDTEIYQGISRLHNPEWPGWKRIDLAKTRPGFPLNLKEDTELARLVMEHYRIYYWDQIKGNEIADQEIAEAIFDCAVNSGPRTSAKLAQAVVQAKVDGVINPQSLEKINQSDRRTFLTLFALARIGRYVQICEKHRENRKYFFDWVKRTLEGV